MKSGTKAQAVRAAFVASVVLSVFAFGLSHGARAEFTPVSSDSVDPVLLGKFRNTNYYVVMELDYLHHPLDTFVRDMRGQTLAIVSTPFKQAMDIEGTGKLIAGDVLNYAGRVNKEIRYKITKNEFGDGVGTCALVPFHTIAVDPKTIPLGSVVQIAETVGMVLPDGSIHDGIWRAEDVGGAIKGDRIDLFIGARKDEKTLVRAGITHLKPLTIRLLETPAESCVSRTPEN